MECRKMGWMGVAAAVLALGASSLAAAAPKNLAYLRFKGPVAERNRVAMPLFASADRPKTLRELVATIDEATTPGRAIDGIVIRATEMALTGSQIDEIGAALMRFRATGKKVHLFTEIYGPMELALGSFVDEVLMQSGGAVSFPGLYMEEMFLASALGSIGVTPDFVQIGAYKGAEEMYANSAPSPAWDQNINQLLDGMYAHTLHRVAKGRGISNSAVEEAMASCFYADGATAMKHKLIDGVIDRMDLETLLEKQYGKAFAWDKKLSPEDAKGPDFATMGFFEAFAQVMKMLDKSAAGPTRDTIAVVHIDGAIMDGESSDGGLFGGASVGSLTIREALADIEDESNVKGVIVRINSPGGSAIASESIWLGLRRVAERKPVWVSVGSMAASGGYYIAVAGDVVYVTPSSIVGSIGVVGGKLALGGLYEKLKINVVPRTRGPMAGVMGALNPWSEKERSLVRLRMTETYELFVSRVKAGRKDIDIANTAEGRLFVGDKAIALKMADRMGGLDVAIQDFSKSLGLQAGAFDVVDYPAPKSFEEMLKDLLPMGVQARASLADLSAIAAIREAIGPAAWSQFQAAMNGAMLLRQEPVILVAPSVLITK